MTFIEVPATVPVVYQKRRYTLSLGGGTSLGLGERTLVMGVLNITPDSFSDGGAFTNVADAVEAGIQFVEAGADLLDVGGESTRPGADPVPSDIERERVTPVIKELAKRVKVPISVDTYKAGVAEAAIEAGAVIVNDISGLRYEPNLVDVVARCEAAIVLMHLRGRSKDMYQQASYHDLIGEVLNELRESIAFALSRGMKRSQIIVDPGIGFSKEADHNYELLARLQEFSDLGFPVLVGPSRKSFLTKSIGQTLPPAERDWATAAAVSSAVLAGVHIVRVHAVNAMAQVVKVSDEIRRYHQGHNYS